MTRSTLLALLVAFAAATAPRAGEMDNPPPLTTVRMLAPGADGGRISERVWALPPAISRLEHYVFDYMPSQQTEIRLAYDDRNLYAAFRCLEARTDQMKAEKTDRDADLIGDDHTAVYLDADGNPKTYHRLAASVSGVRYDEVDRAGAPASWDGDWTVETSRDAGGWRALFTIPFASIGRQTPSDGEVWRANFARRSIPHKERSIWASIRSNLVEPGRWGAIVFGGADGIIATSSTNDINSEREFAPIGTRAAGDCMEPGTAIRAPGPQDVALSVSNPASRAALLTAEVFRDGSRVRSLEMPAMPGESDWRIPFDWDTEGLHYLWIEVRDQSTPRASGQPERGQLVLRSAPVPVYIKPHRKTIARYERLLKDAAGANADARLALDDAFNRIALVQEEAERVPEDAARAERIWQRVEEGLNLAEPKIGRARAKAADRQGAGYAVGVETSLRKVLRDRIFEGRFGEPLRISAARGEAESAQAVIVAYGEDLEDVDVRAGALVGPGGASIPASAIEVNPVDFVRTTWPRYAVDYVGWWPDPLMENAPFDVGSGQNKPVWVTVRPPAGTRAGRYKGKLSVLPANAPATEVAVEVTVRDFDLPAAPHFKTAFALFPHGLGEWYGGTDQKMLREWYAFLLEHRINPTNIYSKTPLPSKEDIEFCVERGMNAFTLLCTWHKHEADPDGKAVIELIQEYRDFLQPRGWWGMPYVYGFDEIDFRRFEELKETYGWLGRRFPDLARMCTVRPTEELHGFVDIWVPLTSNYVPEDVQAVRADGDEVWNYVCVHPFHPWPNYFIDYPAMDHRIMTWMNWKFEVPGLLYYAMNLWDTNIPGEDRDRHLTEVFGEEYVEANPIKDKRWPEAPWNTYTCATWNGDGQLLYPGAGGRPLGSVRLANIRDSIDDYDYLHMLGRLIERAEATGKADALLLSRAKEAAAVPDEVCASFWEYTLEPDVLLEARDEVALLIEALQREM